MANGEPGHNLRVMSRHTLEAFLSLVAQPSTGSDFRYSAGIVPTAWQRAFSGNNCGILFFFFFPNLEHTHLRNIGDAELGCLYGASQSAWHTQALL